MPWVRQHQPLWLTCDYEANIQRVMVLMHNHPADVIIFINHNLVLVPPYSFNKSPLVCVVAICKHWISMLCYSISACIVSSVCSIRFRVIYYIK